MSNPLSFRDKYRRKVIYYFADLVLLRFLKVFQDLQYQLLVFHHNMPFSFFFVFPVYILVNMKFFQFKFLIQFLIPFENLLRNFPIKRFPCVIVNSECLNRSFYVDYALESTDKVTLGRVKIIEAIVIRNRYFLQGLFIDIN